jgi:hypothetical protein
MSYIKPTKNEAIILHHLGLGDHFLCNGMVRYISSLYTKIILVVKYNNYYTVKKLYNDISNIEYYKVKNDEEFSIFVFNKEYYKNIYDLYYSGVYSQNYVNTSIFPFSFYDDINIPRSIMWTHSYIPILNSSKELYNELINDISGEKYVFMHNNTSFGDIYTADNALNKLNINKDDILIINSHTNIYEKTHKFYEIAEKYCKKDIMDYTIIIENAYYNIMSDSSFFCMTNFLKCKYSNNYLITREIIYDHIYNINICKNIGTKFSHIFLNK